MVVSFNYFCLYCRNEKYIMLVLLSSNWYHFNILMLFPQSYFAPSQCYERWQVCSLWQTITSPVSLVPFCIIMEMRGWRTAVPLIYLILLCVGPLMMFWLFLLNVVKILNAFGSCSFRKAGETTECGLKYIGYGFNMRGK